MGLDSLALTVILLPFILSQADYYNTVFAVAETCGTSPERPLSPAKGWHPALARSEKPESKAWQPTERPLSSLENGPPHHRGADLHKNDKSDIVPFTVFFFHQGSDSNRRLPKMWTQEVRNAIANISARPYTRSSPHALACLVSFDF